MILISINNLIRYVKILRNVSSYVETGRNIVLEKIASETREIRLDYYVRWNLYIILSRQMERIIRHESFARRIDFRFLQVVQLHPATGLIPTRSKSVILYLLSRDIYEEIIDHHLIEPIFPSEFPSTRKSIHSSRRTRLLNEITVLTNHSTV